MSHDPLPDYLGIEDLRRLGITPDELRSLDPPPTEYTGDGGRPCWRRDEITDLLDGRGGAQ